MARGTARRRRPHPHRRRGELIPEGGRRGRGCYHPVGGQVCDPGSCDWDRTAPPRSANCRRGPAANGPGGQPLGAVQNEQLGRLAGGSQSQALAHPGVVQHRRRASGQLTKGARVHPRRATSATASTRGAPPQRKPGGTAESRQRPHVHGRAHELLVGRRGPRRPRRRLARPSSSAGWSTYLPVGPRKPGPCPKAHGGPSSPRLDRRPGQSLTRWRVVPARI